MTPDAKNALIRALIEIASGEVGEEEKGRNITKYTADTPWAGSPWCGAFVLWCADAAMARCGYQGPRPFAPRYASVSMWKSLLRPTSSPSPGDVYIQQGPGISHMGIVVEVPDPKSVVVVSGNESNGVRKRTRQLSTITLVGSIPWPGPMTSATPDARSLADSGGPPIVFARSRRARGDSLPNQPAAVPPPHPCIEWDVAGDHERGRAATLKTIVPRYKEDVGPKQGETVPWFITRADHRSSTGTPLPWLPRPGSGDWLFVLCHPADASARPHNRHWASAVTGPLASWLFRDGAAVLTAPELGLLSAAAYYVGGPSNVSVVTAVSADILLSVLEPPAMRPFPWRHIVPVLWTPLGPNEFDTGGAVARRTAMEVDQALRARQTPVFIAASSTPADTVPWSDETCILIREYADYGTRKSSGYIPWSTWDKSRRETPEP